MRLVRTRLGGGSFLWLAATAVATTLVVIGCANGTANVDVGDGGAVDDDAGSRDVNVVPIPRDGSVPVDDSGPQPGTDSGSCTQKVVINELQTRSSSSASAEFIELYNPGACAVALGNWKVAYKSSAGSGSGMLYTFAVGDSITPKGFMLLATTGFTGAKDGTFTAGMADDGQIALEDDAAKVVDSVGYGAATGVFVEKNAAPGPAAGGSVGRKVDGVDSDNNATDFKAFATPTPGAAN